MTAIRADEDYSYLRDPAKRSGAWWEPLKYIPLNEAGDRYLTIGDEIRLRYEHFEDDAIGSPQQPDDDYWRFRALPYADLHLGPRLRVFGQLMAAWSTRDEELKNPYTDETGVDLLQGFIDWRQPLADGDALTLRLGRQVLEYGNARLFSTGPNIRFSFDGGLLRWERGEWQTDAFYVRPVVPELDSFENSSSDDIDAWALYGTRKLARFGPTGAFDVFYVGYRNDASVFNQGVGDERRHTVGARLVGAAGAREWDLEAKLQFGDFEGGDIRAWSVNALLRYTFEHTPYRPHLELQFNASSGDDDPEDPNLGTYNPMFPTGEYFGDIGLFGPGNIINLRPMAGLQLGSRWGVIGALGFYWRQRPEDGIYGVALNLLRPAGDSDERYVGAIAELMVNYSVNRNLSFRGNDSVFEPGDFIEDTGPAPTIHFFMVQGVLKY